MSVTVEVPLTSARTLLNDDDAIKWPDYRIMPKLQQAFSEVVTRFVLVGIPVINEVTANLTVPTNTLDLSTVAGYPTDIIVPIWMMENQIGNDITFFQDMQPVDFIPNVDQDTYLYYWCWQDQTIKLLGALNPVVVQLRYKRNLPTPQYATDILSIIKIEDYLTYKTAALCYYSIANSDMGDTYNQMAGEKLETLVRMNVKQIGTLSAKRRPYHRRYGNFSIGANNGIL